MAGALTYDWNGHKGIPMSAPHMSDREVAIEVRMLMRDQLNHEAVCEMARDRIMALSKRVAELESELEEAHANHIEAMIARDMSE